MSSFVQWIRPAFEGLDGKASHKKLTVFILVLTIIIMAFCSLFGVEIQTSILGSLELLAAYFTGATVYQNVKNVENETN